MPSAGARFLRQRLLAQMAGMRHGRLVITDALGMVELGTPAAQHPALNVHIEILDAGFYRAVAANGSVGAGEAYMDGIWRCDNLVALIQLLVRNRDLL
ncbi:MAG: SAM-dependent methyltransferase, partial [Rhodanobacter sp.]